MEEGKGKKIGINVGRGLWSTRHPDKKKVKVIKKKKRIKSTP